MAVVDPSAREKLATEAWEATSRAVAKAVTAIENGELDNAHGYVTVACQLANVAQIAAG